ncbi:hypothetical protein SAMN04488052_103187 [Aquisalimonas asiatica]|uniref:Uncharacterized protein n=1 Tax=Aquisalimonas asiatica TaxID=406100 RepID=A0A1H8SU87_9GAMM|nr:hypothetical protein SAMN04488052_103187 [Aquisalimonas asiatica]
MAAELVEYVTFVDRTGNYTCCQYAIDVTDGAGRFTGGQQSEREQ